MDVISPFLAVASPYFRNYLPTSLQDGDEVKGDNTMNANLTQTDKKAPTGMTYTVKGDKLTIVVDLAPVNGNDLQLSAKGRSYLVASSHAFQALEDTKFKDVAFSLNVNVPKTIYEEAKAIRLAPKLPTAQDKEKSIVKNLQANATDSLNVERRYREAMEAQSAQIAQLTGLVTQLLSAQLTK
jgi:hypothetical protein